MKRRFLLLSLLYLVTFPAAARASGTESDLNRHPSKAVRESVRRAVLLAESDRPRAALFTIKRALKAAPDYFRAHVEYRNIMGDFLDRREEVEREYESLIDRYPNNPIYLMAVYHRSNPEAARDHLERVMALAPDWAWSHYAKALLVKDKHPEGAVAELALCIEKDPDAKEAYGLLIDIQENKLKRPGDALRTAARLAARAEIRATRMEPLWRLRLLAAGDTEDARDELRRELAGLAGSSSELDELLVVRSAHLNLLKDEEAARDLEEKIRRLDPAWYPQRGWPFRQIKNNISGAPRTVVLANRDILLDEEAAEIEASGELPSGEKLRRMEALLRRAPRPSLRRLLHERLFRLAVKAERLAAVLRHAGALRAADPEDYAVTAQAALTLAGSRAHLALALRYAREAEEGTAEFRPAKAPPNTPPAVFKKAFPEERQRQIYRRQRALALDAAGWALLRAGRAKEAERKLRKSVEVERTESSLSHLAEALRESGRGDEAAKVEAEANSFYADTVRRRFVREAASDFEVESVGGRRYKLSDLRGKVVVINFWATWCVPCVREMPMLSALYEKYKSEGVEVLAVSTDEDGEKVGPFAVERKLTFPVFKKTGLGKLYRVSTIPVNIFIDKEGIVRYRKTGFDERSGREMEVVVRELLK
jgi:thiol-disulfide isomerase/thioredoxin